MATTLLPATLTHRTTNPLILWHLLSLDAPTVATVWLWFIARATRTPIPPALLAAAFVAVWIIYAADRLLDTRRSAARTHKEPRHLFHRMHRTAFLRVIVVAAMLLVLLLTTIPIRLTLGYTFVAMILAAWFGLVHFSRIHLPKELLPGFFFATTVFLPPMLHQPTRALLASGVVFAALCALNCMFIHRWEMYVSQGRRRLLQGAAVAMVVVPLLQPSPIAIAVSLSAALLLLLDRFRPQNPTTLRAAADLALLTPLLVAWL